MLHCLALPLVISALPMTFQGLQSEIVHQVLVVLAVPLAMSAVWAARGQRMSGVTVALLLAGAAALALGAFAEPLHDYETMLTVLGAVLLSAGHISRWYFNGGRHTHQS
jgi:hypothetical protein